MGLKAVIVIPAQSSTSYVNTSPINIGSVSGINIRGVNNNAPTTVNLPANPSVNQIEVIQDQGNNAATNNITVNGNGHNIIVPGSGSASSVVIGENGADFWFNWTGANWGILA